MWAPGVSCHTLHRAEIPKYLPVPPLTTTIHRAVPAVEALLLWRDPVKSGAILGGATALWLSLRYLNPLVLVLWLVVFASAAAVIWSVGAGVTGR